VQKPLPMQPPLAARRQQAVGHQYQQDLVPTRPLTAHFQPLAPEHIELQLPPQHQRQPARAPLSRPAQSQFRKFDPDDGGVRQQPFAPVFGKQRQGSRPGLAIRHDLDRPPPRQFLRIVDLAEVQHVALHHPPTGYARVPNNAPAAVLLAILPANFRAQEHDGRQLSAHRRP
jgi:hypothetical protein